VRSCGVIDLPRRHPGTRREYLWYYSIGNASALVSVRNFHPGCHTSARVAVLCPLHGLRLRSSGDTQFALPSSTKEGRLGLPASAFSNVCS
jgi:hypothetical protein